LRDERIRDKLNRHRGLPYILYVELGLRDELC